MLSPCRETKKQSDVTHTSLHVHKALIYLSRKSLSRRRFSHTHTHTDTQMKDQFGLAYKLVYLLAAKLHEPQPPISTKTIHQTAPETEGKGFHDLNSG